MCNINWSWIAGFFEGEGTLDIHPSKSPRIPVGWSFSCMMNINQVDDGNLNELYREISNYLNKFQIRCMIGKLRSTENKNWKKSATLSLYGTDNCLKFINMILPHMNLKNKIAQVELMRKGITLMKNRKHASMEGVLDLMDIIDEIRSHRTDRGKRKYTRQYLEEYFKIHPPRERKRKYAPPMTDETLQRIKELYSEGNSIRGIGRKIGYTATSTRQRCIDLGLYTPRKGKVKISSSLYPEILKLYEEGISKTAIAREYDIHRATVARIIKKIGEESITVS